MLDLISKSRSLPWGVEGEVIVRVVCFWVRALKSRAIIEMGFTNEREGRIRRRKRRRKRRSRREPAKSVYLYRVMKVAGRNVNWRIGDDEDKLTIGDEEEKLMMRQEVKAKIFQKSTFSPCLPGPTSSYPHFLHLLLVYPVYTSILHTSVASLFICSYSLCV